VENPSQSDEIKKKKEETCLKNYGVTNCFKLESVKLKCQQTLMERYGVTCAFNNHEIRERGRNSIKNKMKEKWDLYLDYDEDGKWICKCPHCECNKCEDKKFTIDQQMFHDRLRNGSELCTKLLPPGSSNQGTTIELVVRNILDKHNITYTTNERNVISPKEVDIYIPDKNIAIECNGIHWHSLKGYKYHLDKFMACKNNGVWLVTLWEDWIRNKPDIVESILLSKLGIYSDKIYARKCVVKEIKSKRCNEFLELNHIQGRSNGGVHLGLYYNNDLVAVMLFSKSRSGVGKNEHGYELVRFCSKLNTQVIGGADKLFKYFLRKYNPVKVVSYSSNDISNGGLYDKLGFISEGKANTSYWYIKNGTLERFHRYNFRKSRLKELGYDVDNLTEREIMEKLPYTRIYDSGTIRWVYLPS
jgi:G:T-mismatch repair DNA endonuclease (very short patch repair protein)